MTSHATSSRSRTLLTFAGFAILLAAASACSSSSSGPTDGALTCRNGQGPESVACDTCGAANCASQRTAITGSCDTYVTCLEACECTSADTCSSGCFSAASSVCQAAITAYADCEKSPSGKCESACSD